VLVNLPKSVEEPPEFFVLTQAELHGALRPKELEYLRAFETKHGVPYGDRRGVATASRKAVLPYLNAWHTLLGQLET
jgi:hypothetical protein